ncbi:MAG: GNAT family N-acetyltransferase [Firmicutes bacterium]|nr:GNAT family N-acetyltransferase [Bacillota bacterium]
MTAEEKNRAAERLSASPLLNVDMLEALSRDAAEAVFFSGADAVLLKLKSYDIYMMYAPDDMEAARALASLLPEDRGFDVVGRGAACAAVLRGTGRFFHARPCSQVVWTRKDPPPESPSPPPIDIRPLTQEYAETAARRYSLFPDSVDYMRFLIGEGRMFGAFWAEEFCGYIGTHEEGSMGLLEVFPEYQRRGVGSALSRWLIARELALGHIPYGQILEGNFRSEKLWEKLGSAFAPGRIIWFSAWDD